MASQLDGARDNSLRVAALCLICLYCLVCSNCGETGQVYQRKRSSSGYEDDLSMLYLQNLNQLQRESDPTLNYDRSSLNAN